MARSPLFDFYDPHGFLSQQAQLGILPQQDEDLDIEGVIPVRRKASITDLMPQEQKTGMLRSLANLGASGLTGLGWLLDTPGALVRGTISGVAEGDPLKGLRGVFASSDDRVSGRDLMRQFGATGDEDTWGNFTTGLLAETALDPLSYLNPLAILGRGALGKAGRALERSGVLENVDLLAHQNKMGTREFLRQPARKIISMSDDTDALTKFADAARAKKLNVDELLDMPAAGLMEARLPFTESGTLLGTGDFGDYVAKGADAFGDFLTKNKYTSPIVNRATAAFDPTVMGATDVDKQWRNRGAWAEGLKREREHLQWTTERTIDARKVQHGDFTFDNERIQNAIRDTIEAKMAPERMAKLTDKEAVAALEAVPEWKRFRDDLAEKLDEYRAERGGLGLEAPRAQSYEDTGFFPSQSIWFNNQQAPDLPNRIGREPRAYNRGSRVLNVDDLVGKSRDPKTDLPMRSETFRKLMSGPYGRELQDKLIAADDRDIPGLLDEAFATLGIDAPYQKIKVDGSSLDDLAKKRELAGRAQELLDEWKTAPKGEVVKAKLSEFGPLLDEVSQVLGIQGDFASLPESTLRTLRSYLRDKGSIGRLQKKWDATEAAIGTSQKELKTQLGDLLRQADRQFAEKNVGLFDNSAVNDFTRYGVGQARSTANAKVMLDEFLKNLSKAPADQVAGGGQLNLLKAASGLGFNDASLKEVLASKLGVDPAEVANYSINEKVIADLKKLSPMQEAPQASPWGRFWDSYTNAFKVGALANPAYHTRNLYSGYLSSLMADKTKPFSSLLDWYAGRQAGKGNYTERGLFGLLPSVYDRIKDAPRYQGMGPQEAIDAFRAETARNRLGSGLVMDDNGIPEQATKALYPGAETVDPVTLVGKGGLLWDKDRTWNEWLTNRGVDFGGTFSDRPAPTQTTNPWLKLHEDTGKSIEDMNRLGTYIAQIRQGASPDAAAQAVFKTQVDYSPRAFTDFERRIKQYVPFYSYTRGIAPVVSENLLYRPGGVQGQSIRTISRAGEPSEDSFTPDYLRQSAAIPLPGMSPADNLQRYLTNIDLPYEGLVNLVSPGIGNTVTQRVTDSVKKTGMNLLGMLNPIIKAPLEYVLNRQLYSGREMSDLYSAWEAAVDPQYGPLAKAAEQVFVNLPGGTRLNSIARTAADDRLSMQDKALKLLINNVAGLKVTDIDQERTKRLAARQTLNELLSTTPGVRTYENITVPEDVLAQMPKNQRDMYLLYKIIQAETAKRARDKKRQQAALDPMQVLGVVNQF